MGTTATQMPPLSQAIVDPKTGLASPNMGLWQQELLRARQAWIPYTPTTTHLTGVTLDCAFQTLGKLVAVRIGIAGTGDGSIATVTLPFTAKSANQTLAGSDGGNGAVDVSLNSADNLTLRLLRFDGTTPGNGVVHNYNLTGVYEAQ